MQSSNLGPPRPSSGDVASRYVEEITKGEAPSTPSSTAALCRRRVLPHADRLRHQPGRRHRPKLAVQPRRAHGKRGPDRPDQSLASSNGRNNFRTLDEIVASAVTPGMSDREKAMALWFQQVSHRFHRGGYGRKPSATRC